MLYMLHWPSGMIRIVSRLLSLLQTKLCSNTVFYVKSMSQGICCIEIYKNKYYTYTWYKHILTFFPRNLLNHTLQEMVGFNIKKYLYSFWQLLWWYILIELALKWRTPVYNLHFSSLWCCIFYCEKETILCYNYQKKNILHIET